MEKQILDELKELRVALVKLVGTADLPKSKQLSPAVLDKVADEFKKLQRQSNGWLTEHELDKYFKDVVYGAGKFIREEFGFSNFFVREKLHYYSKADIQALAKELKARNVNLKRYMELTADKENFNKRIASALLNKKQRKNMPYLLEEDLSDISTSNPPRPSAEIIRKDLKRLEEEFFEYKLGEYVDIYKGNYAMVKFEYYFSKYMMSEIKSRTKKWCENFNYANKALELLTSKKSNFIPVKNEERYEL